MSRFFFVRTKKIQTGFFAELFNFFSGPVFRTKKIQIFFSEPVFRTKKIQIFA